MTFLKRVFIAFVLIFIFGSNVAIADDVGINSARLIQLSDSSYLFETEFSQQLAIEYELPVFPERFTVTYPEVEEKFGWLTIKTTFTTSGQGLNSKDEIILPWRRNGVSLTVQWLDGTIHQGLFLRSLDGIHLPMDLLMSTEKSIGEATLEGFKIGLDHFRFGFIHFFLIIALVLFLPRRRLFVTLLYYAFGQASSMLLFELGVPAFDLLFIDLFILLLVVALVVLAIKKRAFNYLGLLLFAVGLLHGLSVGDELKVLNLPMQLELVALFVINFTIDLIQFALALILIPIIVQLIKKPKLTTGLKYLTGVIAVSLFLVIFADDVLTGRNDVLIKKESQNTAAFSRFAKENASKPAKRPQAAQTMTNPILSYLSIEPFEVRHEILITASTALEMIGESQNGDTEIPIGSQEAIKKKMLELFANSNPLFIDDKPAKALLPRADFVTLGLGGVLIRPEPIPEEVDNGIIGISFIYETESLANDITLNWELFPINLQQVDATTIDPFGGANFILTPVDPTLKWKSSISGYTVPQVEEIAIESPRLPLLSIVIFVLAIVFLSLANKFSLKKYWALILIALGFIFYPFVRSPLDVDFIKQWKPSNERSAAIIDGLLTNVYRSFDYRNESDVYDRLAISVMGDQLTQTYIEQRKGLEIENRGGAKAKVNDVEVLEVYGVNSGLQNDFGIEVGWKINGSVSHFGHMHYRQNRYRAIIWITPENGNWKIKDIEMLDEERLM
jgi:hypothetical protein